MGRIYKAIPGFFLQDESALSIEAIPPRLGLIDDTPERWSNFKAQIQKLNECAAPGTSYKVLFFSRHGQGYHNVAEAKYGTQAWDDYWSKLNGDGEIIWGPDPLLTPVGEQQAVDAQVAWKVELPFGIPLPDKLYSSPLTRALKTCEITFDGIIPSNDPERTVTVVENCREENGVHTCDKRKSRTYIASAFPTFRIEDGFTEEDELWNPEIRETKPHLAERAKQVLDTIFERETSAQNISITAHGGIINGFLVSISRSEYALPTGGVLPVVIQCVSTE
ncbi:phosphoglycerate mutase-like protein [Crucibulum laeve]|uniref:Phosphoglycerate mutase-like protein n=1 Tax=Crucibulum laeve TaxID=68775 RepID=A0A5C3MCK0_9AGAR|nr:phosphoglycerate mutase-like protein [Crucibulum laeve]